MRTRHGYSSAVLTLSLWAVSCGGDGQSTSATGSGGGTASGPATSGSGAGGTTASTSAASTAGVGGAPASTSTTGAGGAPASTSAASTSGSGTSAASSSSSSGTGGAQTAGEAVLQRNNHVTRDGVYVQPTLTKAAAATMHLDTAFNPTITGRVYAQPLYVEDGPGGKGIFIVVTESNNVHAVAETDGAPVWTKQLGTPAGNSGAGCGNIASGGGTLGITGTPAIDLASRTIYLDAVIGNANTIQKHEIHALSIDDGAEKAGYPIDASTVSFSGKPFVASPQNQRGALLIANGTLYVPYGGHAGDCGPYLGWVISVPLADPAGAKGWATGATRGGGIWAVGGLASDGTSVFAATGNTNTIGQPPPSTWQQGDAILRFKGLSAFSNQTADYFTPSNWQALDQADGDLGGSGPLVVDVPGAKPSALVVALGKNGVAYLLDRTNLGGKGTGNGTTGEGLASAAVATGLIMNAPTTYTTASGTYVAFFITGTNQQPAMGIGCPAGQSGNLMALKIAATSPPTMKVAWCADNQGRGSPITTTTDGKSETVVWSLGTGNGGSNRLHGFDGDTGAVIFNGGGAGDVTAGVHYFNSPIAAKGRIIVAANNKLYAFKSP